ncbi:hypothetical protein IJG72_05390 [bacterium]|nr:hypothetical protein [bacterium]
MKKIFFGLIIFGVVGEFTNAAILEPEWTEFCPPRYCDSYENTFSKDATYWYKRRLQFQNALSKCSAYKDAEQDNCYAELRAAEERKNKVWDVRQEEKYRTTEYNRAYNKERMEFYSINQILETIKK